MEILVSIIVPVFNVEAYLPRCLNSILNQTLENLEIILVNDGSTDASRNICQDFAGKDTRIRIINQNNQGLVNARKTGLSSARGLYVGFVDSDDWIEPGMFFSLFQAAVACNADLVAEGIIEDILGTHSVQKNALKEGIYQKEDRNYLYRKMINYEDYFSLGIQPYLVNKLVKRELAQRHIPTIDTSIRIGEDAAAVYPMLFLAERIVVMGISHYHYCLRSESMMWKKGRADEEFMGVLFLHRYLEERLRSYGTVYFPQEELQRYTVNNLLVRAFSRYADMGEDTVLFPFKDVKKGDNVIIYGAGALGRALYQYAFDRQCVNIRMWVDKRFEAYQKLGLPVENAEELQSDKADKVLVAVFSRRVAAEIVKVLLNRGILKKQIRCIDITPEEEAAMILDVKTH